MERSSRNTPSGLVSVLNRSEQLLQGQVRDIAEPAMVPSEAYFFEPFHVSLDRASAYLVVFVFGAWRYDMETLLLIDMER